MKEAILTLLNYNIWAQERIFQIELTEEEFLRELPEDCGSIRDKLVHIMAAEDVWMKRITGKESPKMIQPLEIDNKQKLIDKAKETHLSYQNYISNLIDDDFNKVIQYKNLKGNSFSSPLKEIFLHVLNHGSYHRGQVSSLIRRIKGKPPITDLIEFFRI